MKKMSLEEFDKLQDHLILYYLTTIANDLSSTTLDSVELQNINVSMGDYSVGLEFKYTEQIDPNKISNQFNEFCKQFDWCINPEIGHVYSGFNTINWETIVPISNTCPGFMFMTTFYYDFDDLFYISLQLDS